MSLRPQTARLAIIILSLAVIAVSIGLLWATRPATEPTTIHYSTLMGQEFYDRAYVQAHGLQIPNYNDQITKKLQNPNDKNEKIAGGVVNHHLLAAPLIAQFFDGLATQKPKHIILIGPDHLSRGQSPITASAGTWITPYGELTTDTDLIANLTRWHLVNIEEAPFDHEFSVGGLVPFIKRSLPTAEVTTIIVKVNTTKDHLDSLAAALPLDKDTIVIGSVDFSHYLPSRAAEFHDITNRAIIDAFDFEEFDRLEVDSPPTLRILLKYLERRSTQQATLVANTDSAKLTGQLDTPETTSYLNQYFSEGSPAPINVDTGLYIPAGKKIISNENRFMGGFLKTDDGSSLPKNLKRTDLAVGTVKTATATTYYLFPFTHDKTGYRLMNASEEETYFKRLNIKSAIIEKPN